jgi:uncharacterized protein (UPF0332 family)
LSEVGRAGQESLVEAKLRSAISRAYYSAHHKAVVHVEETQKVRIGRTGKAHREVIDYLKASRIHPEQVAGIDLDRLLLARERADYYSKYPGNLMQAAEAAVKTAQRILSTVAPTS